MIKPFVAAASLAALSACAGPSGYGMRPSSTMILPEGTIAAVAAQLSQAEDGEKIPLPAADPMTGKVIKVQAGDVVIRAPVGWVGAAQLAAPVTLLAGGISYDLPAGSVLLPSNVKAHDTAEALPEGRPLCVDHRTLGDGWKGFPCFVDADGDKRLDKGFIAGVDDPEGFQLISIDPVEAEMQPFMKMPGISEVRIVMEDEKSADPKWLDFQLEVSERGRLLSFANNGGLVKLKSLPDDVQMLGAKLTVLSYDPVKREADIRIDRFFPLTGYGVTTTTTYTPIFVPG